MLSKGSLTVLPAVSDNLTYNLEMQPASKAVAGSSGQTNYLYVSPNLQFNPSSNQLIFNSSVVFGGSATYANGSVIGSGGITGSVTTTNAVANSYNTLVTVSDTAPLNPFNGNMWYYSATGETYIFLTSANSWVSVTSTVPQTTALNAASTGKAIAMAIVFGG